MKRLRTTELQPRVISRHCFGVLVNNIYTATTYNTVRTLEKNNYIFTYERVLKKRNRKKSFCNSIWHCRLKVHFIFTIK